MGKNILTKELLLKSVEEWNEAREVHSELVPDFFEEDFCQADLRQANLGDAKLMGADFSDANLSAANLSGADLTGADLVRGNLSGAYFRKAYMSAVNFTGADLRDADFREANLQEADLSGANLQGANFLFANLQGAFLTAANLCETSLFAANLSQANLEGANFSRASIGYTIFGINDLSSTIGLDSIQHNTPSTIGIDTIYASNGNIPEVFLRGCGVPDTFIEYVRSLTAKPIDYYSCFISYNHKDEEFAKRLHTDLQAGNVRCWFAPHDLPIGAKTRPAIDDAIRIHDKLLLILSEHSVQSNWVEHEVEHALDLETERGKLVLFPVRLDDAVMDSKTGWASNVKRQRNIGDFTKWKDHDAYQKAFSRLLKDLKQSDKPKK